MSEEICPLINEHCDQKEKKCDKCISQEEAWQKINCYIECHDYGISYNFFKQYYE